MTDHTPLDRIFEALREGTSLPHWERCPPCREAAEWVRGLLDAAAEPPLPDLPAEVFERAAAIPRTAAPPARRETPSRWSLARLIEEAFARPALAGVRGGPAQRSLYRAELADLDLEIGPSPQDIGRRRLTGQLLPHDGLPAADVGAILWRGAKVAGQGAADETGVFVIDTIEPGEYHLDVWSPASGVAIRVGALDLTTD